MATAGAFAARVAEVAVSNAASTDVTTATFVAVEKVNSPRYSGSLDVAEATNNDSGGSKEFLPTWDGATLTFEMIADENGTGQEHVWTAFTSKQLRSWRLRPRGDNSGDRQIRFVGIVTSIEESLDKSDVAKYNVTVTKTAAATRDTQ